MSIKLPPATEDELRIQVGVWIAKGLITWCDAWKVIHHIAEDGTYERSNPRDCPSYLPLAQWLLSFHYDRNKEVGFEMAGSDAFFYSAMATNQLMYKYFTLSQQQKIYAKLTVK